MKIKRIIFKILILRRYVYITMRVVINLVCILELPEES